PCGQAFAYKSVLRSHLEKVHKITPTEEDLQPCKDEQERAKYARTEPPKKAIRPSLRPAIDQGECTR
ncbi:unnamed protein product, partial [Symbiodinium pilosum]